MSQNPAILWNGVPIRLTDGRWQHVIEEHAEPADLREEVLQTISGAERVLKGNHAELFAVRMIEVGKAIVVAHRETDTTDGFVITAFLTRRMASLAQREQTWPPQS